MLRVQMLLKLEEVEVKAEEEPEGEITVRSSGEALRPPSKGATFTQIDFFSVWVYLDRSPLGGLQYQKLFGC